MIRHSNVCASLLALGALAAAPSTFAACSYPHAPDQFPDGAAATMDQMVASNNQVKQYIADMDVYMKCVDAESPPPPADAKLTDAQKKEVAEREKMRVQKHNAAVADEEAMRDKWHEVLTAYKAAHPK
jgi:hypothetical protein